MLVRRLMLFKFVFIIHIPHLTAMIFCSVTMSFFFTLFMSVIMWISDAYFLFL